MPGLIISGKAETPFLDAIQVPAQLNYLDDRCYKLKPGEDMRQRRTRWIRSIVVHTTKGRATRLRDGAGPHADVAERIAKLWATDGRQAGCHLSVDSDGTVCCHADLLLDAAYHADSLNEVSIGIELYQQHDGSLYTVQLDAAVLLIKWLCVRFGIQFQCPALYKRGTIKRVVQGGRSCVGVFGHRHQTSNRGPGDPGDEIFRWLIGAGFEWHDFDRGVDMEVWRSRQHELGLEADGIPGPVTCDALRIAGYKHGIWQLAGSMGMEDEH